MSHPRRTHTTQSAATPPPPTHTPPALHPQPVSLCPAPPPPPPGESDANLKLEDEEDHADIFEEPAGNPLTRPEGREDGGREREEAEGGAGEEDGFEGPV